jgi:rubredoxin
MTGPAPGETTRNYAADTRMECKICWQVYDPAEGDDVHQIPPGTPFADLPDFWRCPQCDAGPSSFLPIED